MMHSSSDGRKRMRRRATILGIAAIGAQWLPSMTPLAGAAVTRSGFPKDFLWGAAISGHQVEGDNVNSDSWALENVQPTMYKEPSGAAVDHFRLYDQDINMLASLGLNTFRFSIEWSRVEPVEGMFSLAALAHYRDVLQACRKRGIKTMVTFNHFTCPRWFAARGGWEADGAPQLFARYCDKLATRLGTLIDYAITLNEPNLSRQLFGIPSPLGKPDGDPRVRGMMEAARRSVGSDKFSTWIFGDYDKIEAGLLQAHELGYKAIKAVRPEMPVGVTVAIADDQAVGENSMRDRKREIVYKPWFVAASRHGDFFGVQTYSRDLIGPEGKLRPPKDVEMTSSHMEYYPQALEATIRYASQHVKLPIYVTENGIATNDDRRREAYIGTALRGVANCIKDGIDVRGYIHWSLLDNFEWIFGFGPRYGLIDVDRTSMKRTIKPSAYLLGKIAKANAF